MYHVPAFLSSDGDTEIEQHFQVFVFDDENHVFKSSLTLQHTPPPPPTPLPHASQYLHVTPLFLFCECYASTYPPPPALTHPTHPPHIVFDPLGNRADVLTSDGSITV